VFNVYNKTWLRGGTAWKARAVLTGFPGLTAQVRRLIREESVDIVHFNESRSLLLLIWGALAARKPVVLHLRGGIGVLPTPMRLVVQMLPRRIIAVGRGLLDELAPPFRRKGRAVYCSARLPDDVDAPENGRCTVLTLASFDPFKGYHHLAEAAALVNQALGPRRPRFVWLGGTVDERYESFVRTRVQELGLDNIEIRGWQSNVEPFMRDADLVVMATVSREILELDGEKVIVQSSEGVPRALIEAMAYGKATVGTRAGCIDEAVEDGITGLLVAPSNPEALADAIVQLVNSPERRRAMGEAGRARVATRFTRESMVAGVSAVYDELLAGRP
jgi:glycosyltransferase involved in cell wall biosynthesis